MNESFLIVRTGKDGNMISHTDDGKIIIPTNPVNCGYAHIVSYKEKPNCILAVMKNVVEDYYFGIRYNEFIKVLQIYNYRIAFDVSFRSDYGDEKLIMAYNREYNTIIIACTQLGTLTFESIRVYCPNMNGHNKWNIFESGDQYMSVLNLCKEKGSQKFIIKKIHIRMKEVKRTAGVEWHETSTIDLTTYAESNFEKDFRELLTVSRLKSSDAGIYPILENNNIYGLLI